MKNKCYVAVRTVLTALCLYLFSYSLASARQPSDYTMTEKQIRQGAYNYLINYIHDIVTKLEGLTLSEIFSSDDSKQGYSDSIQTRPDRRELFTLVKEGLNQYLAEKATLMQSGETDQTQKTETPPPDRLSISDLIQQHRTTTSKSRILARLLSELTEKHSEKEKERVYLTSKHNANADKPHILYKKQVLKERDHLLQVAEDKNPMFGIARKATQTLDNEQVEAIKPNRKDNPDNVRRAENIISAKTWDHIFTQRNPAYTYENFLKGIGKYPALCQHYLDKTEKESDHICSVALATMFAHFTQETGGHNKYDPIPEWRQGLYYLREVGWTERSANGYGICSRDTWQGKAYPCGKFPDGKYKSYFGRGAKQLSYNYNYGPFSLSIYKDVGILLNSPEKVADTWLNLASAVFFYVFPQPPKPNMLSVMDGTWKPNQEDIAAGRTPGFGVTTMIINGGVECGGSSEGEQSQNRIEYFKAITQYLGIQIPPDEKLGCANMQQFDPRSSGAIEIYWEEDWSWNGANPDGLSYKCQLVGYQTPFNAFNDGDYIKCLKDKFNVIIVDDNGYSSPEANAGSSLRVMAKETGTLDVILDGTKSKAFGDHNEIDQWEWSQIDTGNKLQLDEADTAIAIVSIPARSSGSVETYKFQLSVKDTKGGEGVDTMDLIVEPYNDSEPIEVTLVSVDKAVPGEDIEVVAKMSDEDSGKALKFQWGLSDNIKWDEQSEGRKITFEVPDTTSTIDIHICLEVSSEQEDSKGNASKTITVEPTGGNYPAWKEGTNYHGGSRVTNGSRDYECKPFPQSEWCGQSAAYYKPGEGSHWDDAWIRIND
ncbi:hypothetical protein NX722_14900 [Endozoicomonas gorgoniicola]|uniref:Chitin-binding type-3 domain-containing protein n=1 Tax=Endozoicomonas gorgoniicola TaxID=1234144 RepID=A0ABT3MY29_9GAMM|nr:glycoside hydrolase family 19 protein [Endozoicomonas gorgoniicola]MCW7553889.1 hypothetical protein [Endozoicomonas gorgoniicola]